MPGFYAQSACQIILRHWLLSILSAVVLFALNRCYYTRYCHPLSKFPGPFLGGVTDFYHLSLFASKKVHIKLYDLHKHYGGSVSG